MWHVPPLSRVTEDAEVACPPLSPPSGDEGGQVTCCTSCDEADCGSAVMMRDSAPVVRRPGPPAPAGGGGWVRVSMMNEG